MKLQEFITETLKQIVTGVKEAQEYAIKEGAKVNPAVHYNITPKEHRITNDGEGQDIQDIEFDVAVTSSEGSKTKGGAGIMVATIGLGVQARTDTTSSSISHIKFKVPVALPIQQARK